MSRGGGLAAAARRGLRLADLEFVQFHPTALDVEGDTLPLLTEALRGAGALLVDDSGRRFMPAIHPDAELAPRDVVARAIALCRLNRSACARSTSTGVQHRHPLPWSRGHRRRAGFDPARHALPITTAAHFHMGGIATDAHGATSMPGLWAAARWPQPDCTAATGSQAIRSWKDSCSARASRTPCARRSCCHPPAHSTCRGARPPQPPNPRPSWRSGSWSAGA